MASLLLLCFFTSAGFAYVSSVRKCISTYDPGLPGDPGDPLGPDLAFGPDFGPDLSVPAAPSTLMALPSPTPLPGPSIPGPPIPGPPSDSASGSSASESTSGPTNLPIFTSKYRLRGGKMDGICRDLTTKISCDNVKNNEGPLFTIQLKDNAHLIKNNVGKYCSDNEKKGFFCRSSSARKEHKFYIEPIVDNEGLYTIKAVKTDKYCSDKGDKIVCDSDKVTSTERFSIIDESPPLTNDQKKQVKKYHTPDDWAAYVSIMSSVKDVNLTKD